MVAVDLLVAFALVKLRQATTYKPIVQTLADNIVPFRFTTIRLIIHFLFGFCHALRVDSHFVIFASC